MAAAAAASRRQRAFEDQLVEEAFLNGLINPIVDRLAHSKPAVPFALRQAERWMKKAVHFKGNRYGLAGAPGAADPMAIFAYDNWVQWAQVAAAQVAERNEGLTTYVEVEALVGSCYVSEFGTPEERNEARATENGCLSFVHMEKSQPGQVREFLDEILAAQDDPTTRAKGACDRALNFRQQSHMPIANAMPCL